MRQSFAQALTIRSFRPTLLGLLRPELADLQCRSAARPPRGIGALRGVHPRGPVATVRCTSYLGHKQVVRFVVSSLAFVGMRRLLNQARWDADD